MHKKLHPKLFLALCLAILPAGCGNHITPLDDDGGGTGGSAGDGGFGGERGFGGQVGFGGEGGFDGFGAKGGSSSPCFDEKRNACGPEGFCEMPPGACASLPITGSGGAAGAQPTPPPRFEGMCVGKPEACPALFAPVCGCDGRTYANDCARQAAGVSKLSQGTCEEPVVVVEEGESCGSFMQNSEFVCAEGLYCEFDARACRLRSAKGTCRRSPESCLPVSAPVCGCDGQTYTNDCQRRAAGASLASQGACGPAGAQLGEPCGDAMGVSCVDGLFCDPQPHQCSRGSFVGTCRQQPDGLCTKEFAPVCGCDGRTYGNDCMRLNAGVAKEHDGECKTTRLVNPGRWGGVSASLEVMDAREGGVMRFDCGQATVAGPLEIDVNGHFEWRGKYTFQGGGGAAPVADPREMVFSGVVDITGTQMKMSIQLVNSMTQTNVTLELNTPPRFSTCL